MAELTVRIFIERNGKKEPFTSFTEEELKAISRRLSKSMSTYYSNHSEELQNLLSGR